jgi:hypothetical protein
MMLSNVPQMTVWRRMSVAVARRCQNEAMPPMPEPRDMEGPVEREEALAAKELRKAKAASAERLCVAPRNGRKPLSVEAPILGNYLVAFRLSGRTDIPQRGILILGQICGEILLHEEVRQQFEGLCQVVAGPTFGG